MQSLVRPAISMFVLLSLITGLIYPLLTTAIVTPLFGDRAAGSLIGGEGGRPVGSTLIGQNFTDPKYFWGRPSATSPYPYNAGASGGSNLGPLNPALVEAVKGRIQVLRTADPDNQAPIPADLVTASGSGLDPEISPAAARYQAARVARARKLPPAKVNALIDAHTQGRQWGLFGEPRVNVLKLNLALDAPSR